MAAGMAFMKGMRAEFVNVVETKTIHWKQNSIMGFGGDRSQTYRVCNYRLSNGSEIPVWVQSDRDIPKPLTINNNLQYGLNNGMIFLVLHDKSQTPYQHRYVMTQKQQWLAYGNELLKKIKGYDASWMMGDYLHNM